MRNAGGRAGRLALRMGLYVLGTALFPRLAFRRLAADPDRFALSVLAVLFAGVMHALRALALAGAGAVPLAPSLLPIPPDNYFAWEMLVAVPVFLTAWILASSALRLARRGGGIRPRGEGVTAASGFALAAAAGISWLPGAFMAADLAFGGSQVAWAEALSRPGIAQVLFLLAHGLAVAIGLRLAAVIADPESDRPRVMVFAVALAACAAAALPIALFIR